MANAKPQTPSLYTWLFQGTVWVTEIVESKVFFAEFIQMVPIMECATAQLKLCN